MLLIDSQEIGHTAFENLKNWLGSFNNYIYLSEGFWNVGYFVTSISLLNSRLGSSKIVPCPEQPTLYPRETSCHNVLINLLLKSVSQSVCSPPWDLSICIADDSMHSISRILHYVHGLFRLTFSDTNHTCLITKMKSPAHFQIMNSFKTFLCVISKVNIMSAVSVVWQLCSIAHHVL